MTPRIPFPRMPWGRAAVVALYVVAIAAFLLSLPQYHGRKTGFTKLIGFGDQFYETSLPAVREAPRYVDPGSPGYDGQFYAQLAIEPLLRNRDLDRALDTPPYRARRILFAWTAYVAGLGRPAWVLKAYALQNIVAWLLLAWLLLRWLPPTSARHVLAWFGCLYGIGMAFSFRWALLEGPSMVLITLGVWAVERNRSWLATGLLGLAGLGRETNVLASGILADRRPRSLQDVGALAGKGLAVALPLLFWALYVRSVYPDIYASDNVSVYGPFAGYLTKWIATAEEIRISGWFTFARFNLAFLIGLTVQAGYLLWRREWGNPWWRVGVAYCLLLPFLTDIVWEGYPGAAPRVLLPIAFAFNVLVPKSRWFWPLAILGNLSAWHGIQTIGVPFLSGHL